MTETDGPMCKAVNSHISAVPRNLFSHMNLLNEKERSLKRFAASVRAQFAEIQQRSAILQQYASELVEMDKQLRAAESAFEEQYDSRLGELNEQEDEYLQRLAELRQQRQESEQWLNSFARVSGNLLESVTAAAQEDALQQNHVSKLRKSHWSDFILKLNKKQKKTQN
jgi:uncharacterized protein (DUF3084 family)